MTIRLGVILSSVLIIGLGFFLLARWVVEDLRPRYLEAVEESLVDSSNILAEVVAAQSTLENLNVEGLAEIFESAHRRHLSAQIYEHLKTDVNMHVYVTDHLGIVLYDSRNPSAVGQDYSKWRDVRLTLKGTYGARSSRADKEDPRSSTLYIASPIVIKNQRIGVLTVCKPVSSLNNFLTIATQKVIRVSAIAGFAVILLSLTVAFLLTHPIDAITRYARQVRDSRHAPSPRWILTREMRELFSAVEQMRDVLEGRKYAEKYIQTLTHEFKSPVSAIQGAAELLEEDMPPKQRQRFLRNIQTEAKRLARIVDELLLLSSLETRKTLDKTEVISVRSIISEVTEGKEPLLLAKKIQLQRVDNEEAAVKGDSFLLGQAISNLLQNAIDFSPMQASIDIKTEVSEDKIQIAIRDHGPGIPDYARVNIFKRFYSLPRPDSQRKSSGLGLPFVREVAQLHQGRIELKDAPNGGTIATLTLPRILKTSSKKKLAESEAQTL
ncbi:MAG: two-component system sensor histidine kinase CreC [Verrucomicrobiota bacterium]